MEMDSMKPTRKRTNAVEIWRPVLKSGNQSPTVTGGRPARAVTVCQVTVCQVTVSLAQQWERVADGDGRQACTRASVTVCQATLPHRAKEGSHACV